MFNIVHSLLSTIDRKTLKEVLSKGFTDFAELRYGYDPEFESKVVCDLIFNLSANILFKHDTLVPHMWIQTYKIIPSEMEPTKGYVSGDYAEQLGTMFKIFDDSENGRGEFEMIRMLLCYAKLKKINVEKYFKNK